MDFTQLGQFLPKSQKKNKLQKPINVSQQVSFNSISKQLFSALTEIDKINYQRSVPDNNIELEQNQLIIENLQELEKCQDKKNQQQIDFLPKPVTLLDYRGSNIFNNSSATTKSKTQSLKTEQYTIKIYYLEQSIYKMVPFSEETTIKEIIQNSLRLFICDRNQQQTLITSFDPLDYQLRFPQIEGSIRADYSSDAIQMDRKISQGFFQTLILVLIKQNKKKHVRSSFQHRQSVAQVITNRNQGLVKIVIYNQIEREIGNLTVSHMNTIQEIFNYIQFKQIYHHKYYITQSLVEDYQLPKDFLIKNLSSDKLYVKVKKYADQSQDTIIKLFPSNILSNQSQQIKTDIILPIGLTEASMYQQFSVIKVNHRGIEQKRILGIDQMKVYNYQQKVRNQKQQLGFFSLIFGTNSQTGTQKPYRLIKDIQQLTQQKNGFKIKYQDKTITYIVENSKDKQKIMRKLSFLISLNQN